MDLSPSLRKSLNRIAVAAQLVADDIDPERLFCFGNADDYDETIRIHQNRVVNRFDARMLVESLTVLIQYKIIGGNPEWLPLVLQNLDPSIPLHVWKPLDEVVAALHQIGLHQDQPAASVDSTVCAKLRDAGERLEQAVQFVPTELERLILDKLNGRAMTLDDLEAEVAARSTLMGGKKKADGIPRLLRYGLIVKGKKGDGYSRPDAPPK